MGRLRTGHQEAEGSSSSEDEDAFSSMSRKKKQKQKQKNKNKRKRSENGIEQSKPAKGAPGGDGHGDAATATADTHKQQKTEEVGKPTDSAKLPTSNTSSTKRHHNINDQRKAKMDALLLELNSDKQQQQSHYGRASTSRDNAKGSYVERGQEHATTNIFVGNLDPSITEEQLSELFVQFGELHSVKIMWPRTEAERMRQRNTGFVCFNKRSDAEEALDACSETDPFRVGRRLMLRWGKDIRHKVRKGAGASNHLDVRRRDRKDSTSSQGGADAEDKHASKHGGDTHAAKPAGMPTIKTEANDPGQQHISNHRSSANDPRPPIKVVAPADPARCRFITTVARFVAGDGSQLENRLIEKHRADDRYAFLKPSMSDAQSLEEHIFYRWRVYSFCQNDSVSAWRPEPFVMLHSVGGSWAPPAVDSVGGLVEPKTVIEKPTVQRVQYATGRQRERARAKRGYGRHHKTDGSEDLDKEDKEEFHKLTRIHLSNSRRSICEAMAFCFERGYAARSIAELLRILVMDNGAGVDVGTKIARLFLISDILFNSQQPGVRNAFLYRDAIAKMAPDVFTNLGQYGGPEIGRLSKHKLRTAVRGVLGAWTEWSVYSPTFMEELQGRFEGRPVEEKGKPKAGSNSQSTSSSPPSASGQLRLRQEDDNSNARQQQASPTQSHDAGNKREEDHSILAKPNHAPRPFVFEQKQADLNTSLSHYGRDASADAVNGRTNHQDDDTISIDSIDGEPLGEDDVIAGPDDDFEMSNGEAIIMEGISS